MFILNIPPHEYVQSLPPQHQTEREIEAIKKDPRLTEKIGNAIVQEIKKTATGYEVVTDFGRVQVDVSYLAREDERCGPAFFELFFHDCQDN